MLQVLFEAKLQIQLFGGHYKVKGICDLPYGGLYHKSLFEF
jgi:hypothetical protein